MYSSNWAGLPPELLVSIADRLPVADYARFPAVCSSWASSIKDLPPKPPSSSHFPWLALIPADPTAPLSFLNRPENHRRYRSPASVADDPPLFYLGHRDGWLVVVRDSSVLLLNPLTSATARLPSVSQFFNDPFPDRVDKIVLSASPAGGSLLAVIAYINHLAFARPGDNEWTPLHTLHHYYNDVNSIIEDEDIRYQDVDVEDVVHHDGKFFAIFANGLLLSLDLSGRSPVASVLATSVLGGWVDCRFQKMFLASAPSGDLLLVRKLSSTRFDVLRFDQELDAWVEVNDLGGGGDWSLFLDSVGSVVLSDMPGLDGNHIFFIDYSSSFSRDTNVFKVGVYDFGKGTAEAFFPEDVSFDDTTYQVLMWFRSSLS